MIRKDSTDRNENQLESKNDRIKDFDLQDSMATCCIKEAGM